MSKLKFRMFILLTFFMLPIFCNAEVKNVSTDGTLITGSFEKTIISLVNQARKDAGVSELKLDVSLTNAARQRAIELGSYYNPNHLRPTLNRFNEVYNEFGINYTAAGENIAYGHGIVDYTTPEGVFNVWMNSSAHRNNILNSRYGALGIGIFKAPNGFYYWVQDFSDSSSKEYDPLNSYIEEYGSYTLKYEDKIYPNAILDVAYDISMNVSDKKELDYFITSVNTGTYNNAEVKLKLLDWNSSNPDIVSVTRNNDIVTLTANKSGVSTISATYADKNISFVVSVVGEADDYYVSYNVNNNSLNSRIDISSVQELSTLVLETEISKNVVTQFYDNGEIINKSNFDIKFCQNNTCISPNIYETDNELIADYIQKEFIFNNSGQTTITAIFENGLRVKIPIQVSLFKFNDNEYDINIGEIYKTSIITDLDGDFSYKSLDSNIATIDSNGIISAISVGSTIIECYSENGFKTYAKVNVKNKDEISINIDEYNIEFVEGEKSIIKYSVNPHTAKVSFKSSNEAIVLVDQDGTLHGLKNGQATIFITVTADNEIIEKEVNVNILKREIPVTDIILDKTSINLEVGESTFINATVVPSDADNKLLTYTSSDERIITVDSKGVITAISSGNALINVTAINGISKSITVSVTEKMDPVLEVDKTNVVLSVGMEEIINIKVIPDRNVTMYSDNPDIATINNNVITAVGSGSTTIHITTDLGDEVLVYVQVNSNKPITSIVLDYEDITLIEGESIYINATIYPSDTTDSLDLGWISDNSLVAVADNGMITAIGEGKATIIVSSVNGVQSFINVNVIKSRIPISEIIVDHDNIELFINDSIVINANVFPTDTTDDTNLTWKSSNPLIAIVDNNGMITATGKGNAVITISASNGISKDINVIVKNKQIPITSIIVDKKIIELIEGEFTSINAQINPNNTTLSKVLSWKSSDMSVAEVSSDGVVTAIKSGKAIITVTSVNGVSENIEVIVKTRDIPITNIDFGDEQIALYVGQNYKINAIIYPLNTTDDKTLRWDSSNNDVLSIDSNGVITALKTGRSIVTATSVNGVFQQIIVDVLDDEISEIHLNMHDIVLTDNNRILEIESFLPVNSKLDYNLVEWSSSNTNIVIIHNNMIIPINYGEAYITARYGNVFDTCRIVVPTTYKNLSVGKLYDNIRKYENNESKNVLINNNDVLDIELNPDIQTLLELYDNFQISWESSNSSILDVNNGKVRFLMPGSASIIVRLGMYSTTLNYNIYNIDSSVSSNKIHVGDTTKINTQITAPTTIDENFYYTVSDSNIISINNDIVTGINPGKAMIYIHLFDNLYKTIEIEVIDKKQVSNKFDVVFDHNKVELENDNGKIILYLENINIPNKITNYLSDNERALAYYKISCVNSYEELNENTIFNVSIPIDLDLKKYSSFYVSYVDGDNLSIINSKYNDGYIQFEANHMGNYLITGILKEVEADNVDNPITDDNIFKYILSWILSFISLGLLVTTSVIEKRMN